MREIFKRVEDNNELIIEIDLEADECKDNSPWLLSVFIQYDGLNETKEGYEEFLENKESLIIALAYEERARYVGSRVIDGWSELYFYAQDSKELDTMAGAILKSTNYVNESNVIKDKKWNFHHKNLVPTELELVHMQSSKIIFLLEEENEDLTISRDVEHYISFETPTQKNRFLNTLELDGFSFKDDLDSEEFEYGIVLIKNHAVTGDEVKKVVDKLFVEIKKANGYYEGWSTTLVNQEVEDSDILES